MHVGQLVSARFFGWIGGFDKAFLDPELTKQRSGPRLIAEQAGNILGGNLSRSLKQPQCLALLRVEVAQSRARLMRSAIVLDARMDLDRGRMTRAGFRCCWVSV